VEIFDPSTQSWALAAPLHLARAGHTATLLRDGRVLVLGGHSTFTPGSAAFTIDPTAEIYDPAHDSWASTAGPLTPRISFTASLLPDGKVLVAGGVDAWDEATDSCEIYDPATGSWTPTGSFLGRWGHVATTLVDGRVLVTGGYPDDWFMLPVADAQIYDFHTGVWTWANRMAMPRGGHTASLLADGRVMVTGGMWRDCCGVVGTQGGYFRAGSAAGSEIYDPLTSTWSPGPVLGTPRQFHTATALPDGTVLVAGGTMATGQIPQLRYVVLDSAEASAATALPWMAVSSLGSARYNHTATLLADGSVLIVGGLGGAYDAPALNTAEIYRAAGGPAH
jgi:hypothetical protein